HARVGRTAERRARDRRRAAERGGKKREARSLGERRSRRTPEQRVDLVGGDVGGGEGTRRGVPREGQCVLIGGAHGDLAPSAPAPRGADVGRRQPEIGSSGPDAYYSCRHRRSEVSQALQTQAWPRGASTTIAPFWRRSRVAQAPVCKTVYTGSIPVAAS